MATQIDDKYKSPYGDHEWQEGYGIWEHGFERGAQWMIEKATTWLNKNEGQAGQVLPINNSYHKETDIKGVGQKVKW